MNTIDFKIEGKYLRSVTEANWETKTLTYRSKGCSNPLNDTIENRKTISRLLKYFGMNTWEFVIENSNFFKAELQNKYEIIQDNNSTQIYDVTINNIYVCTFSLLFNELDDLCLSVLSTRMSKIKTLKALKSFKNRVNELGNNSVVCFS